MAMTNIVLSDGQASPVSHTFVPVSNTNGIFTWEELNADASVGNRRITMSLRNPVNGSPNYKAVIKVWNPKLEVSSPSTSSGYQPAPKVAYTVATEVNVSIPQRSALADRKDETAFVKNLYATTVTMDLLNNLVTPV
jgi:hypothetical protein